MVVLERIVETGESVLVGWNKCFAKRRNKMEQIKDRWNLPQNYVEFLEQNPDNTYYDTEDYGEVEIYGAAGLIAGQDGYSYNPVYKQVIEDWNPNYVVIGNSMADPFCIDISMEKSPVYFAYHGTGTWDFTEEFESLEEFLSECGAL